MIFIGTLKREMKVYERKLFPQAEEFEMLDGYYFEIFHLLMKSSSDYANLEVDDRRVLAWTAHRMPKTLNSFINFLMRDYLKRSVFIDENKLGAKVKETVTRLYRYANE